MASQYATKAELQEFRDHADKRFTDLRQEIIKVRADMVAMEARIIRAIADFREQLGQQPR